MLSGSCIGVTSVLGMSFSVQGIFSVLTMPKRPLFEVLCEALASRSNRQGNYATAPPKQVCTVCNTIGSETLSCVCDCLFALVEHHILAYNCMQAARTQCLIFSTTGQFSHIAYVSWQVGRL